VGEFVPVSLDTEEGLGGSHDERFGPDVLLLGGFKRSEVPAVREMLHSLGADWFAVKVIEPRMAELSQRDALHSKQSHSAALEAAEECARAGWPPRVCFVSGCNGNELISIIDEFDSLGFDAPLFAGVTPRSYEKPIGELIAEIDKDHAELVRQQRASLTS
jgi:hypothetical protein